MRMLAAILSASFIALRCSDAGPGAYARAIRQTDYLAPYQPDRQPERSANHMASIKLNFARLSVGEKITLQRSIVTKMTANPHFLTPNPTLSALQDAGDNLEQAEREAKAKPRFGTTRRTISIG